MQCVRCRTENTKAASHCEKCGAPLRLQRRSDLFRTRKQTVVLAMFLVWLAGFVVLFRDSLFPPTPDRATLSAEQRQVLKDRGILKRKEMAAKLQAILDEAKQRPPTTTTLPVEAVVDKPASPPPPTSSTLHTAWLSLVDPWNHPVSKTWVALLGDGWFALPTRAAYAGYHWTVSREGGETEVVGGIWQAGEAVGLWHLKSPIVKAEGLSLAAWNQSAPLNWMSLDSGLELSDVRVVVGRRQGDGVLASTLEGIRENGVFLQGATVVGWSFGPWLGEVLLWAGASDSELAPRTDVRAFYEATFARGREEKFAGALAIPTDHADLERFSALVEGFTLQPKLSVDDTPEYLRTTDIIERLRSLSAQLVRAGQGAQALAIVSDSTLLEIGDVTVLMNLLPAVTTSQGFEAAIQKLEGVGRKLVERGGINVPAVNEAHLKLYQDWTQSLVTAQVVEEAARLVATAKAYYPNDPYLHLLAVEIALLRLDWQEAERLLSQMEYPAQYRDRAELLSRRISEMKGDEGTIVIRFTPGGNRIPIAAGLNQAIRQEFIVDTGASMMTIPSSTATALNLEVLQGGHHGGRRPVSTAGGVVEAYEVVIDSVEIEGWVERNVSALVMDIPDQPGVGLLGLNYLNRFKIDLQNDQGKLTLRPK